MTEAARAVSRLAAILDLFERERRPLTSRDIGSALGIPRSSLGALLKAMVELHWLAADRRRATYFPAARLARLGGWLLGTVVIDERVRELVDRLHQETGETISVSAISDLEVEVIHVSSQDVGIQLVVHPGRRMSLWRSSVGMAHLATLPDATIRSMHGRAARRADARELPPLPELLSWVRATRATGMSFANAAVVPDVAAVAVALPEESGPRPMILSVGGPSERIVMRRGAIEAALRDGLASLRR